MRTTTPVDIPNIRNGCKAWYLRKEYGRVFAYPCPSENEEDAAKERLVYAPSHEKAIGMWTEP